MRGLRPHVQFLANRRLRRIAGQLPRVDGALGSASCMRPSTSRGQDARRPDRRRRLGDRPGDRRSGARWHLWRFLRRLCGRWSGDVYPGTWFAAAVSYVGPSSLGHPGSARSPAYWRPLLASTWFRYVGLTRTDPDDLADYGAPFPLNLVDRHHDAVLVIQGANESAVTKQESDSDRGRAARARGVPSTTSARTTRGMGSSSRRTDGGLRGDGALFRPAPGRPSVADDPRARR